MRDELQFHTVGSCFHDISAVFGIKRDACARCKRAESGCERSDRVSVYGKICAFRKLRNHRDHARIGCKINIGRIPFRIGIAVNFRAAAEFDRSRSRNVNAAALHALVCSDHTARLRELTGIGDRAACRFRLRSVPRDRTASEFYDSVALDIDTACRIRAETACNGSGLRGRTVDNRESARNIEHVTVIDRFGKLTVDGKSVEIEHDIRADRYIERTAEITDRIAEGMIFVRQPIAVKREVLYRALIVKTRLNRVRPVGSVIETYDSRFQSFTRIDMRNFVNRIFAFGNKIRFGIYGIEFSVTVREYADAFSYQRNFCARNERFYNVDDRSFIFEVKIALFLNRIPVFILRIVEIVVDYNVSAEVHDTGTVDVNAGVITAVARDGTARHRKRTLVVDTRAVCDRSRTVARDGAALDRKRTAVIDTAGTRAVTARDLTRLSSGTIDNFKRALNEEHFAVLNRINVAERAVDRVSFQVEDNACAHRYPKSALLVSDASAERRSVGIAQFGDPIAVIERIGLRRARSKTRLNGIRPVDRSKIAFHECFVRDRSRSVLVLDFNFDFVYEIICIIGNEYIFGSTRRSARLEAIGKLSDRFSCNVNIRLIGEARYNLNVRRNACQTTRCICIHQVKVARIGHFAVGVIFNNRAAAQFDFACGIDAHTARIGAYRRVARDQTARHCERAVSAAAGAVINVNAARIVTAVVFHCAARHDKVRIFAAFHVNAACGPCGKSRIVARNFAVFEVHVTARADYDTARGISGSAARNGTDSRRVVVCIGIVADDQFTQNVNDVTVCTRFALRKITVERMSFQIEHDARAERNVKRAAVISVGVGTEFRRIVGAGRSFRRPVAVKGKRLRRAAECKARFHRISPVVAVIVPEHDCFRICALPFSCDKVIFIVGEEVGLRIGCNGTAAEVVLTVPDGEFRCGAARNADTRTVAERAVDRKLIVFVFAL